MKHIWAHWNKSSIIRSIAGWTFLLLGGPFFFGSRLDPNGPLDTQRPNRHGEVGYFFAEAIWRNCKISTQQKLPTKSIKKLSRLNRLDPPLLFHLVWRLLSVRSYHCSFWGLFLTWVGPQLRFIYSKCRSLDMLMTIDVWSIWRFSQEKYALLFQNCLMAVGWIWSMCQSMIFLCTWVVWKVKLFECREKRVDPIDLRNKNHVDLKQSRLKRWIAWNSHKMTTFSDGWSYDGPRYTYCWWKKSG